MFQLPPWKLISTYFIKKFMKKMLQIAHLLSSLFELDQR